MTDLAPARVEPRLRGRLGAPYTHLETCVSTQRVLLGSGDPEGATVVSEHQTGGKGRRGRAWVDVPGRAILCSVLLRPPPGPEIPRLALVAGLAVAEALEAVAQVSAAVKWPNDVLVGGMKIAGVLLERGDGDVVCGIGVNVNQLGDELPADARTTPTSLRMLTGREHDRGLVLTTMLDRLERRYDEWLAGGLGATIDALSNRDAILGRRIRVGELHGIGAGIAPDGALLVRLDDGVLRPVVSGEVTLR